MIYYWNLKITWRYTDITWNKNVSVQDPYWQAVSQKLWFEKYLQWFSFQLINDQEK